VTPAALPPHELCWYTPRWHRPQGCVSPSPSHVLLLHSLGQCLQCGCRRDRSSRAPDAVRLRGDEILHMPRRQLSLSFSSPVLLLLGGGEQADSEDQTAALAHCMPPRKAPRRANGRRACACPIATLPRLSVRMPARAACLRWAACMPWMGAATSPLWLRCTHALPRPRPLPPEQVPVSTRAAGRSVWPARQLLEWTDVRLSSKPFLRPMLYRSTAGS
jgi:hypothetical protein